MLQAGDHEIPTYDLNGENGMFSFICLENGYKVPTKELDLVRRVYEGKMSVNLQMKMWSDTMINDPLILMPKELKEYCEGMPKWVYEGTMRQARKGLMEKIGFIPTFMKLGDIT